MKIKYICWQNVVVTQIENNIEIDRIIRIVEALSKNEAIGKFVESTRNIVCYKKLDIGCEYLSSWIIKGIK